MKYIRYYTRLYHIKLFACHIKFFLTLAYFWMHFIAYLSPFFHHRWCVAEHAFLTHRLERD